MLKVSYSPGFPHCSLKSSTDLRYLDLNVYISLDVDVTVPNDHSYVAFAQAQQAAITQELPLARQGLVMPAQCGIAEKWGRCARELCTDLLQVRSSRLEHLVVHLNLALCDLYLKSDVHMFMDLIMNNMHAVLPRPHDIMRRRDFDSLRCVDVIFNMRHNELSHELCARYTPTSVDPVVRELFRPWCERGIVKFSKIFRLPNE